jgi:hypothetical protein
MHHWEEPRARYFVVAEIHVVRVKEMEGQQRSR